MGQFQPPTSLSPALVRAARALLGWSQQALAKAAGVAISTVADFERGKRRPVASKAQAIQAALQAAGIRFRPTGVEIAPSDPADPAPSSSSTAGMAARRPIRWVSAQDLDHWADRHEADGSLPHLLSDLIRATHTASVRLCFPSDESVSRPGWDGWTETVIESEYVPNGLTGWEVSVQRDGITGKASDDYQKRTEAPDPLDPADACFIFVTLRRWSGKHRWVRARREDRIWREVRAYDADDLVHWIEQAPAVGQWLATRLGKRPKDNIRELESVWLEWSQATQPALTPGLVRCDRDPDAAEVQRWLEAPPAVLSLQATTTEEVLAFFHAVIDVLPPEQAARTRARCLVATSASAARTLAESLTPLILLLTEPEPGLAAYLVARGHHVLNARDDRPISGGEIRRLARPSREAIASALIEAGIARPVAERHARDCARNLAVLRRRITAAPGRVPDWARTPPPRALLAALLAGGWDDNREGDRAQLAALANRPYEESIADLTRLVGDLDQPLRKVGSTWRVASPADAWLLLAHHLTGADLDRFEATAQSVLGATDPRYTLAPNDRWMAAVQGVHPEYSDLLRHGIGEVLILLALHGDRITTASTARDRAEAIVARLLRDADGPRWWSLARDFSLLAEAAPRRFLEAVEASLDQADPPIRALFEAGSDSLFSSQRICHLLWALESLAWSPEWLLRVSRVLARLDALDDPPSNSGNRPIDSLRSIHLLWHPQTHATQAQRLEVLDALRKHQPDVAWKLMLAILPRGPDRPTLSPPPRWRDFSVEAPEEVTHELIHRGAAAISKRLLADVGTSAARWSELLECLSALVPDAEAALLALEQSEPRIVDATDRALLWKRLRHLLHHHRQYREAAWALPTEVLDRLQTVYERLAPADPLARIAWLFEPDAELPSPAEKGWEAGRRALASARAKAANVLHDEHGTAGVLTLARRLPVPRILGAALFDAGLRGPALDGLIETAARSDIEAESGLADGLIVAAFREFKTAWALALIAQARTETWGETALLTVLRALPAERWVWDQAAAAGPDIEAGYWQTVPVYWLDRDSHQVAYALGQLMSVGRVRSALNLAGHADEAGLPTRLLVDLLRAAAETSGSLDKDVTTPITRDVAAVFTILDQRDDVDEDTLSLLEWTWLPVLTHSPRPAKLLPKALSEQPALFVQMLKAIYKSRGVEGEPEPEDSEQARALAVQAFELLRQSSHLPGTRADGTLDAEALKSWIAEVRDLAHAVGRAEVADREIGQLLSAAPTGADGHWPHEAVREALDEFRSQTMANGFVIGKRDRRGVTTRGLRDGGAQEHQLAADYRRSALAMENLYPYSAQALDSLAESYEREAKRHDQDAERLDWED
ncbi:MAG: helix-turn-helix transcriptional regulator [Xanthomonadaceae bacterium]|nr:helix-turn-helix transcriptional regulator [Xanthomonadaceae bacterium]